MSCTVRMDPLAMVRQLEKYLLCMVAKEWYVFERNCSQLSNSGLLKKPECSPEWTASFIR